MCLGIRDLSSVADGWCPDYDWHQAETLQPGPEHTHPLSHVRALSET